MQHALPFRSWVSPGAGSAAPPPGNSNPGGSAPVRDVKQQMSGNPVVAFARRGCYMYPVARMLLNSHGVDPTIFELDEEDVAGVTGELTGITGQTAAPELPVFFIGGVFLGGLEGIMGAHISGELVPRLKEAGALWL